MKQDTFSLSKLNVRRLMWSFWNRIHQDRCCHFEDWFSEYMYIFCLESFSRVSFYTSPCDSGSSPNLGYCKAKYFCLLAMRSLDLFIKTQFSAWECFPPVHLTTFLSFDTVSLISFKKIVCSVWHHFGCVWFGIHPLKWQGTKSALLSS